MATIKSYTDISQSKKLAEILPLESADMCYIKHSSSDNPNWEFNEDFPPMILGNVPISEMTVEVLPCWSLSVLLSVLGEGYSLRNRKRKYYVCMKHIYHEILLFDNPVDACVDMIIGLKEADLL